MILESNKVYEEKDTKPVEYESWGHQKTSYLRVVLTQAILFLKSMSNPTLYDNDLNKIAWVWTTLNNALRKYTTGDPWLAAGVAAGLAGCML